MFHSTLQSDVRLRLALEQSYLIICVKVFYFCSVIMKVLFAGSLHEQDRDQKRFFNVNCHKTVIYKDLILGTPTDKELCIPSL